MNARIFHCLVGAVAFAPAVSLANIIVDGGFETPVVTPVFQRFFGPVTMGAWSVEAGSVDLCTDRLWQVAAGHQNLDMGGAGFGAVHQDVTATIGTFYDLSLIMGGNFVGGAAVKPLDIYWGPTGGTLLLVGTFTFDTTGATLANMHYQGRSLAGLLATSTSMTLRFTSVNASGYAAVIDDVALEVAPTPGAAALLGLGGLVGLRRRR